MWERKRRKRSEPSPAQGDGPPLIGDFLGLNTGKSRLQNAIKEPTPSRLWRHTYVTRRRRFRQAVTQRQGR